jgi:phosphate/sulfate permease
VYIFQEGIIESNSAAAPWPIALLGGLGISFGFIIFGHRVIK